MHMVTIMKKVIKVPSEIMLEVGGIVCEHQLTNEIVDVDEEDEIITLEIHYSKKDRAVIHEIEDLITDNGRLYEDDDEDDEEE